MIPQKTGHPNIYAGISARKKKKGELYQKNIKKLQPFQIYISVETLQTWILIKMGIPEITR